MRQPRLRRLGWLFLIFLLPALGACRSHRTPDPGATSSAPATRATGATVTSAVRKTVLPNGLRVLTVERHAAPVVSCVLAYRVGSADEPPGKSGMAHFLEHVMFKGTDRYAKGEIDLLTMQHGGSNNAWTSEDLTVYHFSFASDEWEVGLEIEANRMRGCVFDPKELESEKQVVIEELKSSLDSPWDRLSQVAGMQLFSGHPYERPVIGLENEISATTREDLEAFYDKYYVPNNAVLVVAGDVSPDEVVRQAQALFGGIPAGGPIPREVPTRGPQDAERRIQVTHGTSVDRLLVAFPTVRFGDPEDPLLDVVSTLLAGGRSSRLYRRLVEDVALASAVDCTNDVRQYPGAFTVEVETVPDADRGRLEVLVHDELARLAREPVGEVELRRAKNMIAAQFTFDRETSLGFAETLAWFETFRAYTDLDTYLAEVEAVDAKGIQAAATRYFVPENRTVGWSLADRSEAPAEPDEEASLRRTPEPVGRRPHRGRIGARDGGWPEGLRAAGRSLARGRDRGGRVRGKAAGGSAPRFDLGGMAQAKLDNGLTVLACRRGDLPIAHVRAFVDAGSMWVPEGWEGLAGLTGTMLLEGTSTRNSRQTAEAVESVGALLSAQEDGLALQVLSRDLDFGLEVVADLLRRPAFPDLRLESQQALAIARVQASLDEPDTVAQRAFNRIVYGKHPLARPADGDADSLERILRQDVVEYHARHYRPGQTIVTIVGDVDPQDAIARVRKWFGDWAADPLAQAELPAVEVQTVPVAAYETMGLEQVTLLLGHLGVRRKDPDWVALQVMDHVLGTGTGFTDRISKALRDEQGLAYEVHANISGSAGIEPGVFLAYMATRPQNFAAALAGLKGQIEQFLAAPPSAAEVRNAQDYLVGSFVFDFETVGQVGEWLVTATRLGLGSDWLARYPGLVRAVTPAEVHRVARAHVHPGAMTLVAVGPVDEAGKPLELVPAEAEDVAGEAGAGAGEDGGGESEAEGDPRVPKNGKPAGEGGENSPKDGEGARKYRPGAR